MSSDRSASPNASGVGIGNPHSSGLPILSLLRHVPLHVVFFALYPILALVAVNIDQIALSDTYRSIAITLAAAFLMALFFRAIVRTWAQACVLVSLTLLLFFSYGHIYALVKTSSVDGFLLGRHRVLIPLYVMLYSAGILVIRRPLCARPGCTSLLNTVSLMTLIVPAYTLVSTGLMRATTSTSSPPSSPMADALSSPAAIASLPDIYYIITDEYARPDILKEEYGYDDSSFVDFLAAHGFYVAEQSTSNYYFTHLSLASSLNMDYIQDFDAHWTPGKHEDTTALIQHSLVRQKLESLGYTTIGFATGWDATELFDAPIILTPNKTIMETLQDRATFNDFEAFLIHDSALLILLDLDVLHHTTSSRFIAERLEARFKIQREIILAQFDNLKEVPSIPGPKFAFVHIISPHGPYLFGPNGEETTNEGPFTLGEEFVPAGGEGALRYRDQLIYITKRLEETVAAIQATSTRPVVIIIQSDHGSKQEVDWDNPSTHALSVARSIINAYYVPDSCKQQLYASISPVNSFRVLFNCLFGASYELLDDKTYVGSYKFAEFNPEK
jgi:hypothetical protein